VQRRAFLAAGLSIPFLFGRDTRTASASLPDAPLSEYVCQATPAFFPARKPGDLFYQGTHILTHGAFRDLAQAYRPAGGGRLHAAGGGCDDGIAGVLRMQADLGGMCCPVEKSRAVGLPWYPVARDIKVAIVHPANPLTDIGFDELAAVAAGRIARWRELGGEDRAIALVVRNHCPDYLEPVRDLLLKNKPGWSPKGLFVERDEQIIDAVARYPGGLGLVSWVFAKPLAEAGKLKVLKVDGVRHGTRAVRSGRYRLHGPLNVIFARWREETMAPFFDFLYSRRGLAIIGRSLVPVSAGEAGYRPGRWA
jgi:phosphate transport system substrate-binding protein